MKPMDFPSIGFVVQVSAPEDQRATTDKVRVSNESSTL